MHIVVDARMIDGKPHGIARYTYNLIKNLLTIDKKNRYTLLVTKDITNLKTWADNLAVCYLKSRWISISEQWELVKVLKVLKPDLYHAPSFVAPVFNPFPMIMTIHDVNHIALAQNYSTFHRLYYKFIVKPSANKSAKILTDSEFSRKEISKYLMIPDNKIKVIYSGCEEEFKPIEDPETIRKVREKYRLPGTFILYVGGYKIHKNISNLLAAYAKIPLNFPLVFSGTGNKKLIEISRRLNVDKKVLFIGDIENNDLPIVYNCATLFVFPSYYEGFGFPPLEAMACGCPVVASNATSLPEVCGDAAYYVNPYDVKSIADGIFKAIIDEDLKKNLIQKGLQRVRLFHWKKSAEQHMEVFEEVMSNNRRG
ncbi:MAG: glycosyltransferase family 1 protein [Thermodesulfobacteriota bacterium]|nr:glycosyltransferase family 1 protein [Thermodesulfobacteriota bacterium]